MELLGGDPHFRSQPELESVGKAGARIDVHGRAVHFIQEFFRRGFVLGDDAVAVVCPVFVDVRYRLGKILDELDFER